MADMKNDEKNDSLDKYENIGFDYIKKQKYYFRTSVIFSIFAIIMNLITVISFMMNILHNPFTPIFGILYFINSFGFFLILGFISMKQTIFLKKWNLSINKYNQIKNNPDDENEQTTLTDIFYQIVHYMTEYKIYFIILNMIIIYYFAISPFVMFDDFGGGGPPPKPPEEVPRERPELFFNFQVFNAVTAIIILVYMLYLWYHFLHWNKKLKILKQYEMEVFSELKKFFPQ